MGYDDREDRRYRRDEADEDAPRRAGPPSRPRPDDGAVPRSGPPSRPRPDERATPPRSGPPSRPRPDGDYAPRSGPPSRPRPDDGAAPRSGPPSRPRPDDRAAPPPADGSRGRDLMRRVRDGMSGMYEAVSREVRSIGRRDDRGAPAARSRSRDDNYGERRDDWDLPPARSVPPRVSRPRDDARDDESARVPAPRPTASVPAAPPTNPRRHSLARRLRQRRLQLRGPGRNAGMMAFVTTLITVLLLLVIVGGGVFAGYAYALYNQYQYSIATLAINRQLQTSRIFSRDGVLLYQTYGQNDGQRVYITDYCQLPESIKHATIDAEDNTFWGNPGIDPIHIVTAFGKDLGSGTPSYGASTITQQLVKNGVLGDTSKTVQRKLDEVVLSIDVTQNYSKQQILLMYLNTIFYGSSNYGIEAAAQNYFHLDAKDIPLDGNGNLAASDTDPTDAAYVAQQKADGCITKGMTSVHRTATWLLQPWQVTLLAGLPESPTNYDPLTFPNTAIARQAYVLQQMVSQGDQNYFCADPVKQTGCATPAQIQAQTKAAIEPPAGQTAQIYNGYFQNQSGQITTRAPFFVDYVKDELGQLVPDWASRGWNVYTTIDYGDQNLTYADLAHVQAWTGQYIDPKTGKADPNVNVGIQQYAEYVVHSYVTQNFTDYFYCGINLGYNYQVTPTRTDVYNPYAAPNHGVCTEQALNNKVENLNDAALVATDPKTGDILAMVGGVDYNSTDPRAGGQNNIATSDQRSMGSSFKPVVYATAFQMGWYPGMVLHDQPICYPADGVNAGNQSVTDYGLCPTNYIPTNFESSSWGGAVPIEYALGNSLNVPATQVLSFVGARFVPRSPLISMAQRMGITTLDPRKIGPSTALGAQPVPLLQLTEAYATLANNGYHQPSRSILAIKDAFGNDIMTRNSSGQLVPIVSPNPLPGGQAVSPQAAYMVTSILTNNDYRVADFGQTNPLHFAGRDVAAKTGTSQDIHDIVTMGYDPWLALGVWAGNATGKDTANYVIGIAGAGYIFHDVMTFAIAHYHHPGTAPYYGAPQLPGGYFPVPTGMHRAIVNCYTGLAPWQGLDVTKGCNPTAATVPLYLSPLFQYDATGTKLLPLDPKAGYTCLGFGCKDYHNGGFEGADQGQDITWMVNGQDPLVP